MKKIILLLSLLAVLLTTQSSHAQVQLQPAPATIPGYTEGPISSITLQPDGSVIMTVIGVTVKVPVGTPVHSPTRTLTLRQLALRTRLPGRTEPGFIGGTALINGVVEVATGIFTATEMDVEPAENVLIGVVTESAPLRILNSEIAPITDARIPFSMVNQYGFNVTAPTIPVGTNISAAGYYAGDKFQAFLLEQQIVGILIEDPAEARVHACCLGKRLVIAQHHRLCAAQVAHIVGRSDVAPLELQLVLQDAALVLYAHAQ